MSLLRFTIRVSTSRLRHLPLVECHEPDYWHRRRRCHRTNDHSTGRKCRRDLEQVDRRVPGRSFRVTPTVSSIADESPIVERPPARPPFRLPKHVFGEFASCRPGTATHQCGGHRRCCVRRHIGVPKSRQQQQQAGGRVDDPVRSTTRVCGSSQFWPTQPGAKLVPSHVRQIYIGVPIGVAQDILCALFVGLVPVDQVDFVSLGQRHPKRRPRFIIDQASKVFKAVVYGNPERRGDQRIAVGRHRCGQVGRPEELIAQQGHTIDYREIFITSIHHALDHATSPHLRKAAAAPVGRHIHLATAATPRSDTT